MGHKHRHGCGPRGSFEIDLPEGLLAMAGTRGWQGSWGPFHFDFGDEGWSGGRRGRRGRRMFESGELRLVLLKLIADEPRHGYDLIRAIEELTGGEYAPSPGVVYPTLTLLQDMGLIEEAAGEGSRRPFQVTDDGRKHLEERQDEVDGLLERLADLKPEERTSAGPVLGRAVKNVMTALSHRIGRDGLHDELLHEIAAILDEAAQRIERIK
ncbi:PadR family transcriptional regulator [Sphingomonas hankyongi]|uniref:PadR family transcriptional regulator n=1 Tax=Sphingomonas hankyongi TaxID=2908209 RepID=A0ABT0S1K6_9SPHN|nr:PadR family transcriptional regulator [Sphingomonas hankyongi]MCL6729706.1 PadR family transcriptional regulator [Sphingomonas hankyongi]